MKKLRIIPRLDIKGQKVVKGINLEGIRVVGDPLELAKKYYLDGADEILYMDVVASLYERNNLTEIVEKTTSSGIFIPVTVGGGIRSIEDIRKILRAGADKVAINTAATRHPELITAAAKIFGSQCIVGSIEAKQRGPNNWECYIDNGREGTGLDAIEWAKKLVELGAGELIVTAIDQEGTEKGYNLELIKQIVQAVSVPIIACGGAGNINDLQHCFEMTGCDGTALASILHYNKTDLIKIKDHLAQAGLSIRTTQKQIESSIANQTVNPAAQKISIIDYEAGNLKSVIRAFQGLGQKVELIDRPEQVQAAEKLVLPGDGAFGFGMKKLQEKNLIGPIKEHVAKNKPLLGICLGMQLLMSESHEFGLQSGLDLIKGQVLPFKSETVTVSASAPKMFIPHMGWNNLQKNPTVQTDQLLAQFQNLQEVYFIHSYYVLPESTQHILATANYGGKNFCAVIKSNNVYGTQFHPEKSGEQGLKILQAFCELRGG